MKAAWGTYCDRCSRWVADENQAKMKWVKKKTSARGTTEDVCPQCQEREEESHVREAE